MPPEPNVHELIRDLKANQEDTNRRVGEIHRALIGDPKDGDGLVFQHHEMRRKVAFLGKVSWTAAATAIGLFITWIWGRLTGHQQ